MRTLLNSIALEPNRWTKDKIPRFDLADELLPRIAKAGFTRIEVWQHHVSEKSLDEVRAVAARGKDLGLNFPVVGAYPNFHLEGELAERARRYNHELLERAKLLGARWIKCFLGRVKASEITPEQLERTTKHAGEWVAAGQALGFRFSAELHGGTMFDPFECGEAYLAEHPEWEMRYCFQPYDMTDTGASLALIERLGARIVHAHFQGRNAQGFCRLAEADIDYDRVVKALAQANPEFLPSIEFVKHGFVKEGEPFDFDAALSDALADAEFIEARL
ncbi:MAG: TIM barrel protein [Planctomycetota bacterium]|nr:TIM barrel protein [Planctomycetota bacterium]